MNIAIQGQAGSYHDLVRLIQSPNSTMLSCDNFHDVVESIKNDKVNAGIIAVENSIYGETAGALELRTNFDDLVIVEETILDITHRLLGTENSKITEIRSHQIAIGQCRQMIRKLYPNAKIVETADTALAAYEVSLLIQKGITNVAAVASRAAGELNSELSELNSSMNDYDNNYTRFLTVMKKSNVFMQIDSANKTTARLILKDKEDSLLSSLKILSELNINYTSLIANSFRYDSRDGNIIVPIEFTHGWHDERMVSAIAKLNESGVQVMNLGSYISGDIIKV